MGISKDLILCEVRIQKRKTPNGKYLFRFWRHLDVNVSIRIQILPVKFNKTPSISKIVTLDCETVNLLMIMRSPMEELEALKLVQKL